MNKISNLIIISLAFIFCINVNAACPSATITNSSHEHSGGTESIYLVWSVNKSSKVDNYEIYYKSVPKTTKNSFSSQNNFSFYTTTSDKSIDIPRYDLSNETNINYLFKIVTQCNNGDQSESKIVSVEMEDNIDGEKRPSKFSLGGKVGYSPGFINKHFTGSNTYQGLFAGGSLGIALNKKRSLYLQPEFLFSKQTSTTITSFEYIDRGGDLTYYDEGILARIDSSLTLKSKHLDIPILVKIRIKNLYFELGPQYNYLRKYTETLVISDINGNIISESTTDNKGSISTGTWLATGGLSYRVLGSPLTVGARYSNSLQELMQQQDKTTFINGNIALWLGLTF
jgi:hypothetical protein